MKRLGGFLVVAREEITIESLNAERQQRLIVLQRQVGEAPHLSRIMGGVCVYLENGASPDLRTDLYERWSVGLRLLRAFLRQSGQLR